MELKGWVDRQIPARYFAAEPDELRRARVVVLFCAAFLCYLPIPVWQNLAADNAKLVPLYVVGGLILTVVPSLLRRSLALAGNTFVAAYVGVAGTIAYSYGGQASSQVVGLCTVPLMALLMAGRKSAKVWLGVVLAIGVLTALMGARGYAWPRPAGAKFHRFWLMGYCATVGILFALASLYENAKELMRVGLAKVNAEMRLVLDNVGQGFLSVDLKGGIASQRSAVVERWFGAPAPGDSLWAWLAACDEDFGAYLQVAWEQVSDGFLPTELALDMLPARLDYQGRSFGFTYRPVQQADGTLSMVVVVISDLTAQLEAEKAELLQRELSCVFERCNRDRAGFLQFWEEACSLMRALRAGDAHPLRLLHTLKGNCLLFGVRSVGDACHDLESRLQEAGRPPNPDELREVGALWDAFVQRTRPFIERDDRYLEVAITDYQELFDGIRARRGHAELSALIAMWRNERTEQTFVRMGEQAKELAARLGKQVEFEVNHADVRLDPSRFGPLWQVMVHALRNSVDHGVESPEERRKAGKRAAGLLRLSSQLLGSDVVIELSDDGRGVNWQRVREKAQANGLPIVTDADLCDALFKDGISTAGEITEVSGRGVGMGALSQTCSALGGQITLHSEPGKGTRIALRIPLAA